MALRSRCTTCASFHLSAAPDKRTCWGCRRSRLVPNQGGYPGQGAPVAFGLANGLFTVPDTPASSEGDLPHCRQVGRRALVCCSLSGPSVGPSRSSRLEGVGGRLEGGAPERRMHAPVLLGSSIPFGHQKSHLGPCPRTQFYASPQAGDLLCAGLEGLPGRISLEPATPRADTCCRPSAG